MSRYVDKAMLAQRLLASPIFKNTTSGDLIRNTVIDIVLEYPTADVVEVVRCKDCILFNHDVPTRPCCNYDGATVSENHYCSYGERKVDK